MSVWKNFRIWRLRRKENRLEKACAYHYDKRKEYALKAYDVDQFHQPRRWGELMSFANWQGLLLDERREELLKVRAKIKALEGA